MAEQVKISNGNISAVISTIGAELKSVKKDGQEILWEGDPTVWAGQAPLLFPICGGLKDDKFIFEGREYILEKHGYARHCEFEVEKSGTDSAVFLLRSDAESLEKFPFEYELRVAYALEGNTVKVSYEVKNTDSKIMYFSIGSHEGYACPEGIEEYSVIFECEEAMESNDLDGNLLKYDKVTVSEKGRELPLKYEYFAVDALVFTDLKSRKATLKNRKTGKSIEVVFKDADYLLIWTKPGAKYICIEPWSGIPDFVDSNYDITQKTGITALEAGKVYTFNHTINL